MLRPSIRLATAADLPAINSIYNYYVLHSTCTYQTEAATADERAAWFAGHGPDYPVTVIEEASEVIGWGSLSRFHPRAAYRPTIENSIYVRHDCLARGIGKLLLEDLIQRARELGYHSILALISADQEPSIKLHARMHFATVGHLVEVGWKFGRWLDVVYMQLQLRVEAARELRP